nr:hypothetical protein [Tanacetum cinerariifolium]
VLLPKRSQTIFDAPLGFVGIYLDHFTLANLRTQPLPYCAKHMVANPALISSERSLTLALLDVLYNMLNSRTRKLKSTFLKAKASCDAIREREVEKDKAYATLENMCNEALQDLNKNPLVLDMRSEFETMQGQVDRLHEIDRLRQDRAAVVSKVATKLICSDEIGLLVARLVKAAMFHRRCTTFDEVLLPKRSQTIFDAPLGFVGIYPDHFTLANLRIPIPEFVCEDVLDNMLNSRTRKLTSTFLKAKASCDAIREREVEKDKAYATLENMCNEALQDLNKNPLVLDMRSEFETMQGQVDRLYGKYSRLVVEEKK